MSCVTNDMRALSPVPEVAELSQICEGLARQRPSNIQTLLHVMALIAPLLNAIPNVVFFIKNVQAHYLMVNTTLTRRCGLKTVASLLGKTSADVFPSALGLGYTEQDMQVLREGVTLRDQLEMHLYNGRERGWCLTQRLALRNAQGQAIGMAGTSHNLQETQARYPAWQRLAIADDRIHNHYHRPIAVEKLTALSGMLAAQIERCCKCILHLTPRQMIHKIRLERTTELLAGDAPITDIALQCDYTDRSAFSRQFKTMTGSTPRDFRVTLAG